MIDPTTIIEMDDCDGESLFCFGQNLSTGRMEWAWVSVEALEAAGRIDLLRSVGLWHDDDLDEAA